MDNSTSFEELSNDVLCEIFDYLNALDLFLAFASLNARISSVLKFTRLHVIIDPMYYRRQIEFLSHHLTFHSHQVISLDICDTICGQINTIAYLFERYEFPTLRSCTFRCLDASFKLENVIKRLKKQIQLVSLHIFQSYDAEKDQLSRNHAHLFSEMVLLNTPFSLRCATLRFHYDYPELIRSTIIDTNLTYLELLFYGTFDKISIYSLIPILRIHKSLRHVNVIIKSSNMSQHSNNFNIPNHLSINNDDLLIVPSLKKFNLQILTQFDIHSLGLILHCMPNLHELSFTFITKYLDTPFIDVLLNGNTWQQILRSHVPYLNKFNIHISLLKHEGLFDLESILDSFRCFVTQYDRWHMAVSRSETFLGSITYKRIVLRTLNYPHLVPRYKSFITTNIHCNTFEMISTDSSDTNNHRFQSHINSIEFFMPRYMERQAIQSSSSILFRNIDSLVIYFLEKPSITSFVKNLFTLIYRYFFRNELREYINNLSSLIDLSTIVSLEFRDKDHFRQSHLVPYILLACGNVTKLIMHAPLLALPIVIDNPNLTVAFSRIESIRLIDTYVYFTPKSKTLTTKLVQCFPSLTKIEIRAYRLDYSISVIDLFLTGFAKLRFIILEFLSNGLPGDPISRDYIIQKRRQSFGLNKNDEYKVNVILGDDDLRIWIP